MRAVLATQAPPALPLVFVNQRVIVVDKPPAWLSVPSRLGSADPRPCVGLALQEQLGRRIWPVHRLDEEVRGLLVFALDAAAHRALCTAFEQHAVRKTYHATTQGPAPADAQLGQTQRWTSRLLRGKRRAYVHPAGKEAVTLATLLSVSAPDGRLQWQLEPLTGRPHQLRVELARRGCPIVGDALYGSQIAYGEGIALAAVALDFSASAEVLALGLPARLRNQQD
jgi:tRNA pseudouridine32 synthase/23S rRNA pseudouridine746 synthase